jgi:hypothetical protein
VRHLDVRRAGSDLADRVSRLPGARRGDADRQLGGDPDRRLSPQPARLALGINNIAGIVGTTIGLVVGGVLAPISWRLVFLVSVPIGLFGTVWAYAACASSPSGARRGSTGGGTSRSPPGWSWCSSESRPASSPTGTTTWAGRTRA